MAQPKDYMYFLVNKLGQCFVVLNYIVDQVSSKVPINSGPDGWQDKSIRYQRNLKYGGGMWRNFTNPLKWVLDGALILRDRVFTKFTNEDIYLVIHRLDKRFGMGWKHKFFYRGRLDLSSATDKDNYVECNIMEDGLIKHFKANEDTEYEIDLNVPEAITIKFIGPKLKQRSSWLMSNGSLLNDLQPNIPELQLLGTEALENVGARSTRRTVALNPPAMYSSEEYFLTTGNAATTLQVKWAYGITLSLAPGAPPIPSAGYQFQIRAFDSAGTMVYDENLVSFTADPLLFYRHHNFEGTESHTIPANCQVFVRHTVTVAPTFTNFVIDEGGTFDVSYDYQHAPKEIKALRPSYVAQQLVNKMTGTTGVYSFLSTVLSGEWDNLVITSGDGLRRLDDAKLVTSYTNFFKSYNVPLCLTTGIRNSKTLYIEYLASDYRSDIIAEFPSAREVEFVPAKDYQYSRIKFGWPNTNTENVNGKDEFNVTTYYSSPNIDVNKELDITSAYYASMYEAVFCIIGLQGKDTTDDESDKRVFMLHVNKEPNVDGEYEMFRDTYDSITGVIDPATAANVELSPKKCMLRWKAFLRSVFYGYENGYLTFLRSDKNDKLSTTKAGVTVSEKSNLLIGGLGDPILIPWEIKFTSPVPYDLVNIMEAGPNGTFKLIDDLGEVYGFPQSVSIQPSNNALQETIMFCSPITDLSKRIRYGR